MAQRLNARAYSRPKTARTASRAQTVAVPRHVTIAVPWRAPLPRDQERPAPPAWGRDRRMPEIREEIPAAARAGPHPQAGVPGPACKQVTSQHEQ